MSNPWSQIFLFLLAILAIKAGIADPSEIIGLLLATRPVHPIGHQR